MRNGSTNRLSKTNDKARIRPIICHTQRSNGASHCMNRTINPQTISIEAIRIFYPIGLRIISSKGSFVASDNIRLLRVRDTNFGVLRQNFSQPSSTTLRRAEQESTYFRHFNHTTRLNYVVMSIQTPRHLLRVVFHN